MVVLDRKYKFNDQMKTCKGFEADMCVVCRDGTDIKKGQQGTVYVASIMQTAIIEDIKEVVCNSIASHDYKYR